MPYIVRLMFLVRYQKMVLRGRGAEERVEQCLYYVFEISS